MVKISNLLIICSFNRHLKACKYSCSVIEDSQFEEARQALDARSKELKKTAKKMINKKISVCVK